MRDRVGEGKASGNLGNTFKMLGRFDEAIECCSTHLFTSKELNDQVSRLCQFELVLMFVNVRLNVKVGEGRALYNLGNVYHTKGKQMAKLGLRDPGDFPEEVKQCLLKAVHFYE